MNREDLQALVALGEDSSRQFKTDVTNADSLAADLVAFSNSHGGMVLIGVADDGTLPGLSSADVRRLNQLIGNANLNLATDSGVLNLAGLLLFAVHRAAADEMGRIPSSSGKSSGKTEDRILDLLAATAGMTIPDVAEAIGLSSRAVEKQIARLRKGGRLRRVGSRKAGRWEVVREGR